MVPTPYFGSGNGLILLENLGCTGNETDISNCSSNGWGHSDCNHDQDVSLLCGSYKPQALKNDEIKMKTRKKKKTNDIKGIHY